MMRNDEAHFAEVPSVDIERSRLDRSKSHKLTGMVGQLLPIYCQPVLPGTTVTMDTSKIIRFQTMVTPIFDDLFADIHWWFVPERLCWTHFKEFMGENTSSAWLPSVTYTKPALKVYDPRYSTSISDNFNRVGSLLDYMGFPVGVQLSSASDYVEIDATPFRAYALICSQWWRDQNLTDPLVVDLTDSGTDATAISTDTFIQSVAKGGDPFVACKTFDMFTSCLPSPQKGPTVQLPLGTLAPVVPIAWKELDTGKWAYNPSDSGLQWRHVDDTNFSGSRYSVAITRDTQTDTAYTGEISNSTTGTLPAIYPSNLYAQLSNATAASIASIRQAFQLQRYYEALARSGSRYHEVLKSFFKVDSGDARVQIPEYLGGNRFPINVEQVANTAQTNSDALGDVGAFSRTSDYHSDFTHSFVEHGWLIGTMVIRYHHSYSQGLPKMFSRFNKLDYYWPTFAHISEQPIDKQEIYVGASGTFGYNEAWCQYRYDNNTVAGLMRPYISGSLGSWHLGDDYASAPTLSDSWIREDRTNVDRVLTVTSAAAPQFWADFYFNTQWTVPMPLYSVPGLIDHF